MVDKKYVRDYKKRVQKILIEEYGIRIDQKDIDAINTFLFKNIVYSLMKHVDVRLIGFFSFNSNVDKIQEKHFEWEKKKAAGKSTVNQPLS